MADNLRLFRGLTVSLTLSSGKTFSGLIKDVGEKQVHLEKLVGKEYFDALVRIDSIEAIDARFRTIKR